MRTNIAELDALRGLAAMKRLRGTGLDPFGHSTIRRIERELPGEYVRAVATAIRHLTPDNATELLRLAELPDQVRGYEEIKLANVARYRRALGESVARITGESRATSAP